MQCMLAGSAQWLTHVLLQTTLCPNGTGYHHCCCCPLQEHVRVRIQRQLSRLQRPDYIQTLEVGGIIVLAGAGSLQQLTLHRTACVRCTELAKMVPLSVGWVPMLRISIVQLRSLSPVCFRWWAWTAAVQRPRCATCGHCHSPALPSGRSCCSTCATRVRSGFGIWAASVSVVDTWPDALFATLVGSRVAVGAPQSSPACPLARPLPRGVHGDHRGQGGHP